MKRPLAVIGFIYLATSAAAVCLFPEVNFTLCVTAAVIAIAACFVCSEKKRDILAALLPASAALLVIACCQVRANDLSDQLSGQSCVISGEICEIPRRQYGRWRYIIETEKIDLPGVKQNIRILVTSRNTIEEAMEGDRLTCEVQFLQGSDETGYSSTTSLRADGINARAWCKPYSCHQVIKSGFRMRYIPEKIRRSVVSCIRKALPERTSAMLCGMLLGDTDYMDSRTVDNFRTTGIAHMLAVSGLHLTLLTLAFAVLLRRLRMTKRKASIFILGFILVFMAVTGFPPSVVRAGVMHIMAQLGCLLRRNVDSMTSMSISILLMCIVNPWAAADIGLQLSVCATLGLLFAAGRVNCAMLYRVRKYLNRTHRMPQSSLIRNAGKRMIGLTANTVTACIAILPLTAIHFRTVSLISPVTNILCVYFACAFLIIGIIASAIYCIPLIGWMLSLVFRFAAAVICVYLESVTAALAKLPFAAVNTSYSYMPSFFLIVILLTVCAFVMNRRLKSKAFGKRLRGFVLCEMAALLFAAMLSHQLFLTGAEMIVFDVNSGAVCVCAKNRTHALIAEAGGDSYDLSVIRNALRTKGVMKVDAVAVSDDSASRSGNIYRLIDEYSPDYLITDIDLNKRTEAEVCPYESGVKNESLGLCLETFTDSKGGKWQRLTCGEATAVICPEKGNCALLPESWRSCDAVIAGKEISETEVLTVGAIIVTAKESKADELCQRLRNMGFRHVYSTSVDGSITLSVKNGKLKIRTVER